METRKELLMLFENNKGVFFSGEEIANRLAISRTAVWKAVNRLRMDGYKIDAIQNKGYRLAEDTDILSSEGISKYLKPACTHFDLNVFTEVTSTNALLREKVAAGAPEGYCVIAGSQTAGKGRTGRSFYSPSDTGIYMSILLRPKCFTAERAVKITSMAAVAVCEAIECVANRPAEIKWVNDIYMNRKKVCGILTEASFSLENGYLEYAILGVGMNVYPPKDGFPKEIEGIAGSILDDPLNDSKNRLTAEFMNRFMQIYQDIDTKSYMQRYRKRNFVIGKTVGVLFPEGKRDARVLGIDENCRLIVQYLNGEISTLASGEISLDIGDNF